MPRYPCFAPTVDDSLTISLSKLKEWGYLKPGVSVFNGCYAWTRNGEKVASVSYRIEHLDMDLKRMTLDYLHRKTSVTYSLDLVAVKTNLGDSKRWYFVCPKTGKRCLKIICPNGSRYFFHRTSFGLLYNCQKKSKGEQKFNATFDYLFRLEDLQLELWTKYRKLYYRGKPTPLMKKFLKCKKETESQMQAFRQTKM